MRTSRAAAAAFLAVSLVGGASSGQVSAAAVLGQAPYLGVSCPAANSTACDRVGLAVWLRTPARSVNVTIDGRRFSLNDPTWSGPARNGLRRMFAGFLQPAGLRRGPLRVPLRWAGSPPVAVSARIVVTSPDGTQKKVVTRIGLSAGWG